MNAVFISVSSGGGGGSRVNKVAFRTIHDGVFVELFLIMRAPLYREMVFLF